MVKAMMRIAAVRTGEEIIMLDPEGQSRLVRNWGNRLVEAFWKTVEAQPCRDCIDSAWEMKRSLVPRVLAIC